MILATVTLFRANTHIIGSLEIYGNGSTYLQAAARNLHNGKVRWLSSEIYRQWETIDFQGMIGNMTPTELRWAISDPGRGDSRVVLCMQVAHVMLSASYAHELKLRRENQAKQYIYRGTCILCGRKLVPVRLYENRWDMRCPKHKTCSVRLRWDQAVELEVALS